MKKTLPSRLKKLGHKFLVLIGLRAKKKKSPDLGENDQEFQSLHQTIKEKTLVTKDRCFAIYQWAKLARSQPGEIAEVGVYKGGTGKIIATVCPEKKVHLFDTFAGMPETDQTIDYHQRGEFADTSLSAVQEFFKGCDNVVFHPGLFPETGADVTRSQFCLVHVDVDIYNSVKECLSFFYDRLVPGGIMIFDDYEWKDTPGVKKAIDEFLADKKEIPIVSALYQCMIIKI